MDWYQQDESVFLKTLADAFKFQKPSDTFTRTSCQLERLRGFQESNIAKIDKMGYTSEMSHFIRSGVLTRQKALLELERLGMNQALPEEAETYIREVGLTKEEFLPRLKKPLPLSLRLHYARVGARRALKRLRSKKG